jgi:hypothetical protein
LPSRFSAAPNAYAPTTQASASAWQSSKASPKHTTEPSPSPPTPPAGSASRCNYPPRHHTSAALVLLANRLTDDARAAAFARILAIHDNPGWNPSDLYTHASLHPLNRSRIDVGSEQLPLACLRTAAALASRDDQVQQVTRRLTATLLRPTDNRHAAPLLERALVDLAPVTPLPLEQLATHPAVAVRRAAAYSWGRQSTPDPVVAEQLVRDPHATVRLQIARALRYVDNDANPRYRQLLDDLRQDVSYAVRHAAALTPKHSSCSGASRKLC